MFAVYRMPLEASVNVLVIPESSKVLSVGIGKGGAPSVWYTVEIADPSDISLISNMYQVIVIDSIPTGHAVELDAARVFLGTVNSSGKVYHLFRRGNLPLIDKQTAEDMQSLSPVELRKAVEELTALAG